MNLNEIKSFIEMYGVANCSISMNSTVKMNKKHRDTKEPNPYVTLTKQSNISGIIGVEYEEETNIQREVNDKEANFKAQELPWGQWAQFPYLIENKGSYYIRITHPEYDKVVYSLDGLEVDKSVIIPYIAPPSEKETEIKVLTVNIENIGSIEVVDSMIV